MFFKNDSSKDKTMTHITKKTYYKLSQEKKILVLMHMKNRGTLRHVLAVHVSQLPFESFALSNSNLMDLGKKFFEVYDQEKLLKED